MTTPTDIALAPPDKQSADLRIAEPVERTVGYAIVGLGQLAVEEILPAFASAKLSRIVALVSGHRDKAETLARTYGVGEDAIYDYGTFDSIADNPEIDAVYVVLPNAMHAEFTIRAFQAGKHVLCEKPMAASSAECRQMIAAAERAERKLMIAYRLQYEPLNRKAVTLCRNGDLGAVRTFSSSNCQMTKAPNIRLSAALAGGPVQDIGIYSINTARACIGEEPVSVTAVARQPLDNPQFREVPASVSFTLEFPSGAIAHCDFSFEAETSRHYRVNCEKGVVTMDPAFAYRGLRLIVKEGEEADGTARNAEFMLAQPNQFAAEIDHFSDCILNGRALRSPGEEGLADMHVIEAIARAFQSGQRESVDGP